MPGSGLPEAGAHATLNHTTIDVACGGMTTQRGSSAGALDGLDCLIAAWQLQCMVLLLLPIVPRWSDHPITLCSVLI
jgi:hypothetical protein